MDRIDESLDSRLEKLLRLGLADRKRLDFYRRILNNPKQNINNAEYRPVIVDVLNKLINNTIKDPTIYNKTQQNLQSGRYINEAAKIKKKNVIPPTQRSANTPHPETASDILVKETSMTKLQFIKEIVSAQNLAEARMRRQGTNYRKQTAGSVSAAVTGKPRKGTRKARASSPTYTDNLVMKARRRILKTQQKIAQQRQHTAKVDRQETDFYQRQKLAQDQGRI